MHIRISQVWEYFGWEIKKKKKKLENFFVVNDENEEEYQNAKRKHEHTEKEYNVFEYRHELMPIYTEISCLILQ